MTEKPNSAGSNRGMDADLLRPVPPSGGNANRDLRFIMPVDRPLSAILASWCGLLGLAIPFLGLAAIAFGVMALRRIHRNEELIGRARSWFGIVTGVSSSGYFAYFSLL